MKFLTRIQARINSMHSDDEGATAVEYGLMVGLIAAAVITAVALIGTNLNTLFDGVAKDLVVK